MIAAAVLLQTGCGQDAGPDPAIHDSKYVAMDHDGENLSDLSKPWPCVLDQYTGLMWEVKDETSGLHDWRHTYSWFSPDESHDQGLDYRGIPGGGACKASDCDTWGYLQAVNAAGYCGYNDWRIPSRDELASINDPRKMANPPTINTDYFPYGQPMEYWSANDYSFQWDTAWVWNYQFGHDRVDWKKSPKPVRLVRGEALHLKRVED